MAKNKTKVAVLFGGKSPEHDVSIITGLQVLEALDPEKYDSFPVYLTGNGRWFIGDELRAREFYLPAESSLKSLTPVRLDLEPATKPTLTNLSSNIFGRNSTQQFDVAVLAFHGVTGEDGGMQGLFEVAGVPYTGMRLLASSVLMDKVATKKILDNTSISLLPSSRIRRPQSGLFIGAEVLEKSFPTTKFPCCVKPANLGSSIGVAQVNNWSELSEVLPDIFRLDNSAILEPFVEHLIEYNVSVTRAKDQVITSAIETPKRTSDLLDFKTKYLSGTKAGDGPKSPETSSEGMLSLTREINPELPNSLEQKIRSWATQAFEIVNGTGAPRVDFLGNSETGEIWLNEINPCPGSFAYFLWQAAENRILFTDLLNHLIDEALQHASGANLGRDPTPNAARLFPRKKN